MMTRRQALSSIAAAAAPAVLTRRGAAAPGRPPNIVFILSDDHRYDFGGALGHPWLKTPGLDRLIREGVHFRNAFVTTSLCSPSRASILTGMYVHAHRVNDNFTPLDASLPVFPELLRQAGYRTGFIGKWHMGGDSDEPRPGFDYWLSFRGQGVYTDPEFNRNGAREPAKGYVSDLLTREAERYIAENAERPFLLYLSHKAVHYDFEPAPRHRELYAHNPIPYPASMPYREEEYEQKPEWIRRRRYSRQGVDGMFGHQMTFEEGYRNYCRSLMGVDDSVAAVTAELEKRKLAENTILVYMGDNGYMWGEHGLLDKRSMHEPSIRVPLVAWAPGRFRPAAREEMALNLDLAPTFLEAAGAAIPRSMHGRSLMPLLRGERPEWRTDFLYEYEWEFEYPYTPTLTGLRTSRYSYCQTFGQWDKDELYDLTADPDQRKNLLGNVKVGLRRGRLVEQIPDARLKETVVGLQKRMREILLATGGDPRRSGLTPEGSVYAL